jgi:hypothetical protein
VTSNAPEYADYIPDLALLVARNVNRERSRR